MKERLVIIGAGSAMFTRGLLADLVTRGWETDLALVDVDPAALEVARRLSEKIVQARRAPVRIGASTDRRQVLPGATTVICTIGVGGRRAWEQDVLIPRRHGIFQPVGDTVMPGGSSRALRMIPAMVDIARDVMELCPGALFFNHGNPMSPVCRAVRKATAAPIIGLCHGVNHVAGYLAKTLGLAKEQLQYTAVGVNHLTWFTEVSSAGRSLMPRLLDIAQQRAALTAPADDPFTWWLLRQTGAFPAVLDRHVTEFFPQFFAGGAYYGRTLGVDAFSFEQTIAWGDQGFAQMKEHAYSSAPLPQEYLSSGSGEHEQVLEIIESIRGGLGRVYSANLPNAGQVPNLPADAIVESPARAGSSGLEPLPVGPISEVLVGTLATRLAWVETIVEAALQGDRRRFVQALILDGAVRQPAIAELLADELLQAQAAYLPRFSPCPGLK